jgi:inorganic phosphate transporter, PiT family
VDWLPIAIVITLAMAFNYTNGFHDAANAIATSVSTRALTPRIALFIAAIANFVGSFIGNKVAKTVGSGIIEAPDGHRGLTVVAAALIGAICWNLLTWWKGLPSSSSHALIGGLGGAAIAASATVQWKGVLDKVIIPMVISPLAGIILGYIVMATILWLFRRANPGRVSRGFRYAQSGSAIAMALGHGIQDAAKTMGVVVLALNVGGYQDDDHVPLWVKLLTAAVISLGTYSGGWRIMRTLGRKIIHLDPPQGFAAESSAAVILYIAGLKFGVPISTTHTITSAIMGVGATKRLRAVRWGMAGNIVGAWVLTFPGAGAAAALAYGIATLIT